MEILYLISPQYLKSVTDMCMDYSFYIAGYRNIKDAIKNLYRFNEHNILGYAYVGDYLPSVALVNELIKKIDLMYSRETQLILAVRYGDSLNEFIAQYNSSGKSKVQVKVISDFDMLNDKIIKRDIVGSLLLTRHSPYITPKNIEIFNGDLPSLNYTNPLPKNILNIFSPIIHYNSKEETLINDSVLKLIFNVNTYDYIFRKAIISAYYGDMLDITEYEKCVSPMIFECIKLRIKEEWRNGKTKISR